MSGLTFGIDRGSLVGFLMNDHMEYVGRAINVSCRLQGSIKDKDDSPQYKAILTKPLYQDIIKSFGQLKQIDTRRKLKNIADDKPVNCVKVVLKY